MENFKPHPNLGKVDLSTCEKGDILISSHGEELIYVAPTPYEHYTYLDHVVEYKDKTKGRGTRTNDGYVFAMNRMPWDDHDIVEIIKKK